MNEDLSMALLVLGVGMVTVFLILSLVVLSGQLLIKTVNHFSQELEDQNPPSEPNTKRDKKKIAAIVAVVDTITGGKGKVIGIERES